jgi:hypothetical protein
MLVPLLVASQASEEIPAQAQTQTKSKGTAMNGTCPVHHLQSNKNPPRKWRKQRSGHWTESGKFEWNHSR